jgi:hypothetical protein
VERVGVLIRAIRRLDAASAELEPVAVAERGLAALTRVRLAGLTSPGRGDEALAAVLARGAPAGGGEAENEGRRPMRRLAEPTAVAAPAHAFPTATIRQRGFTVAAPTGDAADGAREWPAPNPSGSPRWPAAAAAAEVRRRPPAEADAEAPTPPRALDSAVGVTGLEWVAPRVPGGTESAETRVVDGAPDAASPSRWADGRDRAPCPRALPAPAEPVGTIPAIELEGAPEPGEAQTWPAPTTSEPRALPRDHGLEALVRAWQDTGRAQTERLERATNVVPFETGDTATSTSTPTTRTRTRDRSSEREDETLAFGDALGRVLVAELRRYGIEVDAG